LTALTTEQVALADLRPYPNNPRNGDTDAIMESLRVNGQFRPIVVSADGVVLAGNHTMFAAMELGWEHIAAVRLAVHSDSPEAAKIVLADNRTGDRARYDDGALLGLLASLDGDLYGTAFTGDDLAALAHLASTPLELDHLAERVGPPAPEDTWTTFTVRLPADLAADLSEFCASNGGAPTALRALLDG
jgi:ParB-like chromosome segregation protein Spo0J